MKLLAWVFLLVALAAGAGVIWLARDRRQVMLRLGIGAAIGGFLLAVALGVVRSAVIDAGTTSRERDAVGAVWDAFLKDLHTAAWILAASGAVVAAAAASLIRPVDIDVPLRRAAAWVTTEPERPVWKVVRGVALIAAGLLFVLDRDAVLQLIFTAVGLYLVYAGVMCAALARVSAARSRAGGRQHPPPADRHPRGGSAHRRRGRRVLGLRRDEHGGARARRLQRPRRAVRPSAGPGGARRHPQRDVRARAGLVLGSAGPADPRSAPRRHPGAADRHALRRQAAERPPAHRCRRSG